MAIAFRAATTAGNASGGNLTINKPTGTVDDDILILCLYREAYAWTLPSGFAQVGSDQASNAANMTTTLAWKRAASEGSSYTVNLSGTTWRTAALAAFSGCLTGASPIDTTPTGLGDGHTTSGTDGIRLADVTTTVDNAMLIGGSGVYTGTDNTAGSSGYTVAASGQLGGCGIVYKAQASSGATGQITGFGGLAGADTGWWATIHFALKPAVAAASILPTLLRHTNRVLRKRVFA